MHRQHLGIQRGVPNSYTELMNGLVADILQEGRQLSQIRLDVSDDPRYGDVQTLPSSERDRRFKKAFERSLKNKNRHRRSLVPVAEEVELPATSSAGGDLPPVVDLASLQRNAPIAPSKSKTRKKVSMAIKMYLFEFCRNQMSA